MNCSEAQKRLSQFHDNQLSQEEAARVSVHLTDCSSCAVELESFQQLSGLSQQLIDPPIPPHMWKQIEAKIDSPEKTDTILAPVQPQQSTSRLFVLAATVLVRSEEHTSELQSH